MFTPPGLTDTVEMPGNNGGANFGGAAVDPLAGKLYVVSKDLPAMLKLQLNAPTRVQSESSPGGKGRAVFESNCQLCHGADLNGHPPATPSLANITARLDVDQIQSTVRHGNGPMPAFPRLSDEELSDLVLYLKSPDSAGVGSQTSATVRSRPVGPPATLHYRTPFGFMFTSDGLPAISPPWTTLTAYNLNTGSIEWQKPLGEVPELAAKGIHDTGSQFPKVGPVVTAGGLLFAGTRDGKLRALDTRNGKELWEYPLDAGIEGIPAVYELDGHEYIAVCASARLESQTHAVPGRPSTPIKGEYVVFGID